MKKIHELGLGEEGGIPGTGQRMVRVPGGWIAYAFQMGVFVPYSHEFSGVDPKDGRMSIGERVLAARLLKEIRAAVGANMEDQTCNWIAKEIDQSGILP